MSELGLDTDGMVESTAKLRSEIMALTGVDIMDGTNQFKSTFAIMQELANKWQDLSDIQQATVTELIAGKRQGNIVSSLMENFDIAENALETSLNSSGSAMREHEKWQQSLESRILSLKSSWQGLSQAFLSSDFLKVALNGIIGLADGATKLIDTFGTLPTLITTIATGMSIFKNKGFFSVLNKDVAGAQKQFALLGKSFKDISRDMSSGQGLFTSLFSKSITKADVGYITDFMNQIKNGVPTGKAWANTMTNASVAGKKMAVGVKQGTVELGSLKTATLGGKAALFGLEAAATAANIALTMGLSFAIQLVVEGVMKLVNADKELAEKVEEITSKFREQSSELEKLKGDYDTTNESSMISKYEKLSKGVDGIGRNISLTADEYAEYQNIVNTIAGQIPSLVTGYDEQGNAILSCAGNVNQLTEAYQKLIHTKNQDILTNTGNIEKDFANTLKDAEKGSFLGIGKDVSNPSIELLEKVVNGNYSTKEIENLLKGLTTGQEDGVYEALYNAGIGDMGRVYTTKEVAQTLSKQLKEDRSKIKGIIDDHYTQFADDVEEQKTIAQAKLSEAFDVGSAISGLNYGNISEELQAIAYQTVNNLDFDFFSKLSENGKTVEQWTTEMLNQLNAIGKADNAKIEAAFDLQTQFNGGEISYGEYVKGIQDVEKTVDRLDLKDEVKNQIKLSLNTEKVAEDYEALKKRLTSDEYGIQMKTEEAENFLDGLNASEYAVAVDLIASGEVDFSKFDIKSFKEYIEEQAKLQESMNFTIAMDVETESIEALNTAMAESVSGAGLSSDAITALKGRYAELAEQGYDLSSMFEETSNGIHLNREAISEFEQKLASDKLSETEGHLTTLKGRYDELTDEIKNCTDAGERANLYTEQQQVAQKINDLATLASQYEGLTSAYNAWQNAESAGNERDMYENIISGFETVEDELSRGWIDDGTIKFLELITGETDLATKSASELKEIWKGLDDTIKGTSYSVKDFFTTDEDGNSTDDGVYNFLKSVKELKTNGTLKAIEGANIEDLITTKNGEITAFNFDVVGGDEAIAEALGISEELVQIMKRAADDAGFVVTIDGKWTQLADLKTSAEKSGNALKKLKTDGLDALKDFSEEDLTFNFDASSLKELNTEFEKANNVLDKFKDKNGQIKTDKNGNMVKGAKEALEVASYYQATIDKLTEPVYMQLETNQVEENLQEPLTKMQEFERLSKEKHQLKLTGDTDGLKDVEAEMDEIAKYLDNLDEETKIDLEIDGLSQEEIKDKLEKGEIEVPATVDIQLEMSEDIKDMRLLMMNELGLVSDNEIKLKIGYEIDDSLVDKLDDEEKEVVIKYIEENEDAWNKLSEEDKEVFIELVASGVDLETLTNDETKEVIIDFVTKNEDEFDKLTDEEKEVVVDLVTDDSALESLENHQIEIEAFARIFGVEKVDDLKAKLDGLTDKQIQVLTKVLGQIDVEKLKTTVAGLDDKTVQAIAKALGEGDVEGLKTTISGLDDKTVQAIAQALGYNDVSELNSAIDNLDPKTVQAIAKTLGITDVNSLKAAIDRLSSKDVKAVANVSGKGDVDGLRNSINNLQGKTVTVWAQIRQKASSLWSKLTGGGGVDGTAHVNGTAFADGTVKKSGRAFKQGDWGTKDSGVALGGEEAPELLVRNGRWHLIGEKGAEFFGYRKGDIKISVHI